MNLLADRRCRRFLCSVLAVSAAAALLTGWLLLRRYGSLYPLLLLPSLGSPAAVLFLSVRFLKGQLGLIRGAEQTLTRFLSGQRDARIDCEEEGALFRFFHTVNTLSAALNAKAEREKQANSVLKDTISDISHQLKTPLAALSLYNGLIAEADTIPDVRALAASSEAEIDRMSSLVRNLLKLARLDAGVIRFEMRRVSLAGLMSELKRRFSLRAEAEKKTILLSGGPAELLCDVTWLSEALGNILKNALDHTSPGGEIRMEWGQTGDLLCLSVRDDGSGIHPEDLPYIFKRFYRSRFSRDTQGIGLGLPLAATVIEAHGGTIEVESEPGRGTVFRICFPVSPPAYNIVGSD